LDVYWKNKTHYKEEIENLAAKYLRGLTMDTNIVGQTDRKSMQT